MLATNGGQLKKLSMLKIAEDGWTRWREKKPTAHGLGLWKDRQMELPWITAEKGGERKSQRKRATVANIDDGSEEKIFDAWLIAKDCGRQSKNMIAWGRCNFREEKSKEFTNHMMCQE